MAAISPTHHCATPRNALSRYLTKAIMSDAATETRAQPGASAVSPRRLGSSGS
jgi:hypothetical protein